MNADRVSVVVLAGFLGSGKTTLLRRLLAEPQFSDTAVIVNELGEVALDHELLAYSSDSTIVLPGGCVCCSIREDIEVALRDLFATRDEGRIPPFSRLVIETTGIADPLPLLMTLHANPLALARLNRPTVVTVVDGVLGAATLQNHPEAVSQVANADLLVVSKADLAIEPGQAAPSLNALNPWARIVAADLLAGPLPDIFATPVSRPDAAELSQAHDHVHHGGVRSFSLIVEQPLDWTAFGVWMTMLLHRHGANVLRVKGIVRVDGLAGPVVFHSAQHLVHPPEHLSSWPSHERRSRLVFIVRGLEPDALKASLLAFNKAAGSLVEAPLDHKPAGAGGSIAGRPVRRATAPRWIRG